MHLKRHARFFPHCFEEIIWMDRWMVISSGLKWQRVDTTGRYGHRDWISADMSILPPAFVLDVKISEISAVVHYCFAHLLDTSAFGRNNNWQILFKNAMFISSEQKKKKKNIKMWVTYKYFVKTDNFTLKTTDTYCSW